MKFLFTFSIKPFSEYLIQKNTHTKRNVFHTMMENHYGDRDLLKLSSNFKWRFQFQFIFYLNSRFNWISIYLLGLCMVLTNLITSINVSSFSLALQLLWALPGWSFETYLFLLHIWEWKMQPVFVCVPLIIELCHWN